MYAIDIAALTSLRVRDDFILKMLLGEIVDRDPEHAIDCVPGSFVVKGAPFLCDDERAWAITAIIRKRCERYELPIYHRKEKGRWKRI